jgi:hypothetical protein
MRWGERQEQKPLPPSLGRFRVANTWYSVLRPSQKLTMPANARETAVRAACDREAAPGFPGPAPCAFLRFSARFRRLNFPKSLAGTNLGNGAYRGAQGGRSEGLCPAALPLWQVCRLDTRSECTNPFATRDGKVYNPIGQFSASLPHAVEMPKSSAGSVMHKIGTSSASTCYPGRSADRA